jgi:uncharacterized membrane protein
MQNRDIGDLESAPRREPLLPIPDFTAILLPHRSLSRKGFMILMLVICAVSVLSGILFISMGAWPVTGFFGLDTLLCYAAFRWNYRAARLTERIELKDSELRLTRLHPSGKAESWSFNPYWVRFELRLRENAAGELSLTSHGRKLIFGAFLADSEKENFAAAFEDALARNRTASY